MIPTLEEADLFAALQFPHLPPNERTLQFMQDYLTGLKAARRA